MYRFVFVLSLLLTVSSVFGDGSLVVHAIDVGQADSTFIRSPEGKTLLIDTGENNRRAETYLESIGVKSIDVLIATHPHIDHIGSMFAFIDRYDIGQVVMPRVTETTTLAYLKLLEATKSKGLRITEGKAGLVLDLGPSVSVECLAPNGTNYPDVNDYSVVVKLTHGEVSFLLTGDASANSEREMVARQKDKLPSTVLKVGHHGSGTATIPAFFEAVAPEITVVSCGTDNRFGHPSEETVERIKDTALYRTDRHGTIVIISDGKRCRVTTARTAVAKADEAPTRLPGDVVYFSKRGKRYHREGCRYLVRSLTKMTRADAEANGLTPCAICKP